MAARPRSIHAIETVDGESIDVDVVVWCTGFRVDDPRLAAITGIGARTCHLQNRPRAYLGVSTPGYPNAFLLLGPNTALGHNSVIVMIEAQVGYAVQASTRFAGEGRWLDVRRERLDAFIAEVDRKLDGQVWQSGCETGTSMMWGRTSRSGRAAPRLRPEDAAVLPRRLPRWCTPGPQRRDPGSNGRPWSGGPHEPPMGSLRILDNPPPNSGYPLITPRDAMRTATSTFLFTMITACATGEGAIDGDAGRDSGADTDGATPVMAMRPRPWSPHGS